MDRPACLLLAMLLALPSCSTAKNANESPSPIETSAGTSAPAAPKRPEAGETNAQYPQAIRGSWMLEPTSKPCYLPLNPDSDGQLVIKAEAIEGYEATYTPVRVTPDSNTPNVWHVISVENYLGTQKMEMTHTFTLEGNTLTEQDGEYTARYVRCTKRKG